MAWGLPPKFSASLQFSSTRHKESIELLQKLLEERLWNIESVSAYTIQASKKLSFTFYSFINMTRPVLMLSVRADEDGNVIFETRYEYNSRYNASLNDLGKCKRYTNELMLELQKVAS